MCVPQILGTGAGHEPSNVLKMGVEAAYQLLAFGLGRVGRLTFGGLRAQQSEHLGKPASGGAKLPVLSPAGTTPITSQRGFAGAFDSTDYGFLAIGGVRALRLLGRKGQAISEARDGIERIFGGNKQSSSPALAHVENVLRFELALLNEGGPEATEVARTFHLRWPRSLLLHADLVKILSITGAGEEAARILATMSDCEYRRRLEGELKKKNFFD